MEFALLELAKKRVEDHKNLCIDYDQRRAAAKKEVAEAKAEREAVINHQIDGEVDYSELSKTQAKIDLAEAKYKRLIAEIGEQNPALDLKGVGFISVKSQIDSCCNGALQVDMKEELDALKAAEERFLAATETALIKFYTLRQDLRQKVMEAENLFDKTVTGALSIHFSESLLRSYGLWWDTYDAANALAPVKKKAMESVDGPSPELKGIRTDDIRLLPKTPYQPGHNERVDGNGVIWTN